MPVPTLRVLPACLLLAATMSAQTGSGSGSDPADPQQPTNPLQEPVKPPETETSKPKAAEFNVSGVSGAEDQTLGEVKLMTRYTELGGDTTRSFRVPGSNNLAEFNFFTDRHFTGNHRFQLLTSFRATDDQSIDPERLSIQKAYLRIFSPKDEIIFGDSLVNYSRLSFNQNIRGVNFSIKLNDTWKVSAVGGVFIDRYGSLYKDLVGRPFLAAVIGGRVEATVFNRDSKLGFNLSDSRDQLFSLPAAPVGTVPFPANNTVSSVDLKLNTRRGLRLEAEFAGSFTDFDSRPSPGCAAPCNLDMPQPTFNGNQSDWGFRTEGSYRHKRLTFRGSYVRYEPNFASINARQIADLQDFVFRTSYEVTGWLTAEGTLRRSNNDLKDQLLFETRLWGPEARFTFHDLPFYRRAVFEVGYRHRDVEASNLSINRFVRIPYAEFSLPVRSTFLTIGYERRQAVDMADAAQSSNTDRAYAGLRGVYDWGSWHINPAFRFEFERQTGRPRITQIPSDPTLDHDNNRLATATLFVEAPRYFVIEGAFRSSSATIFGPSGFRRPAYKAALTYKIRNDENLRFTFGFERNNNFFFTSPNYDERMWSGTLLYRFGRRGQ
jgi:hypothetical protein